ncbi:MAG: VanZ-like protein [Bacilli bacterium]|nr:VanZ-like protein [Bacilli bacterium]
MSTIEMFLKKIISELETDDRSRCDVYDELHDHLQMSKRTYMENGLSEKEAEQKAIADFGKSKEIGKELQKSMYPNRDIFLIFGWILFIPYILSVFIKTLTGGIVTYLNGEWATQRFDHYQHIYQDPNVPLYNLFPFRTIYHYLTQHEHYNFDIWFNNTLGNVFLFIPLGMLLPMLFRSCQSKAIAIGISSAIAAVIELIQIITQSGIADVDSVFLRVVGSVIGLIIYIGVVHFLKKFRRRLQTVKS